jgi:hypothetical protein
VDILCPSENDFLARASGSLSVDRAAALDAHVDGCPSCRVLLAEAAMGEEESPGTRVAAATFASGELIASRYVVVRWLAAGGMGEVYEVQDTWVDERIALKTIVAAIADDPRALSRLKAEVRIARRVTHENVCRVYDLGFHRRGGEQIAFLTMELVPGVTLRGQLAESGPFGIDAALPLVKQMAEALRHAHAAGIVHRDFKSDNVMLLDPSGHQSRRIVVMDFGLARQSLVSAGQALTPQSRTVFGTLDYMSPEQVMGRNATAASDVYSLGIVIYELLTGRLPFEGESPLARALRRVTEKAPSLAKALPTVEAELDALVSKCLQLRPEDRFQSADDLLRALVGESVQPRGLGFRVRRNAGTAAVLLLTLANVAFAIAFKNRAPLPAVAEPPVALAAAAPSAGASVPLPRIETARDLIVGAESTPAPAIARATPPSVTVPPPRPKAAAPAPAPSASQMPGTAVAGATAASNVATSAGASASGAPHTGAGDTLLNPFAANEPAHGAQRRTVLAPSRSADATIPKPHHGVPR